MKSSNTIRQTLFIALFMGIIVPTFVAGMYKMNSTKDELYHNFESFRHEITQNIGKALQDPLYYFSPNNASLVLEVIKKDERISKIEVYDALSETQFIIVDFPRRKKGEKYSNKVDIERDGEQLGWVEIEFNDNQLKKELNGQKQTLQRVSLFTFLVSVAILVPLVYYKILLPLEKLLRQSKEFENNKFELTYTWDKRDEISLLGRSFEKARLSILSLIGELQDKNTQLQELYTRDQLTSLFNRYKLDETLQSEMAKANRYPEYRFGIILVDLDHFKQVNDTYGHQIGDLVLCSVADIFTQNLRKSDVVGRWGGEEFMILIPYSDEEILAQLAEKIRSRIESNTFAQVGQLTASFGTTQYRYNEDIEACIARVDHALYQAKDEGRNRVIFRG